MTRASEFSRRSRQHYKIEANRKPHDEVAYSLLSTKSAVPVVEALGNLLGKNRPSVDLAETRLRSALEAAADKVGDPALADLGRLPPVPGPPGASDGDVPQKAPPDPLDQVHRALGKAEPKSSPGKSAIAAATVSSKHHNLRGARH